MTEQVRPPHELVTRDAFDAVLFDLDGVLTDTATVHAEAWRQSFDEFFDEHAAETGTSQPPFDLTDEYLTHVDGKPRYDGVRDLLASRGIQVPEGEPDDPPEARTVRGLGNRKNQLLSAVIRTEGVTVFDGSVRWLRWLVDAGFGTAVVSSSRNATMVLQAAGLTDLFGAQVDGIVRADLELPGKPAPDTYLEAARRLEVPAERAVVVEDTVAGVEAGRAGGFGLVIGVSHSGGPGDLQDHGADVVLDDLGVLVP